MFTCTESLFQEVEPGKWIRSKPYRILVERSSAIQRGTLQLDSIPVDEDHSNLVKFAENDQAYQNICARIEEVQSLRLAADAIHLDTAAPAKAVASREYDLECKSLSTISPKKANNDSEQVSSKASTLQIRTRDKPKSSEPTQTHLTGYMRIRTWTWPHGCVEMAVFSGFEANLVQVSQH
ncbi:MAG: hypothetical protein AUG51_22715 [Acidobacteria bacterium 13_1_20CM_3_53_8]|nr:MAG: hypothetical protein AUG51_22715 [Acidobacteria bacterium 13_1_20CM_3_53_8]